MSNIKKPISDYYEIELRNIKQQVDNEFPAEIVDKLKKISYEISSIGFSEQEACAVADFPYEKLMALKEDYSIIARLLEMNKLEYERSILKNITKRAKDDDKLGQWLLERMNPDKYNPRKGSSGGDDSKSLLKEAIKYVQSKKSTPVDEKAGQEFMKKRSGNDEGDFDLNDILG